VGIIRELIKKKSDYCIKMHSDVLFLNSFHFISCAHCIVMCLMLRYVTRHAVPSVGLIQNNDLRLLFLGEI
jgi:hypothetical protein